MSYPQPKSSYANIAPLTTTQIASLSTLSPTISISPLYTTATTTMPYVTTYPNGGGGGSSGYTYSSNGSMGGLYNINNGLNVSGNASVSGIVDANDIILDGVSMKEIINKIQSRLAILVPDPAKLEKYAALKECYNHYLFLEALIGDDNMPNTPE